MASTTSIATASVQNLGPLTTTFTAPSHCNRIAAECLSDCSLGWQDQSCYTDGATNAIDCSPATTLGAPSAWISYAYSPGLYCPSGFTTACLATYGASSNPCTPYPILQPGETGAICCQNGFAPPNQPGDACVSIASGSATFDVYSCNGQQSLSTAITLPSTVVSTTFTSDNTVYTPYTISQWIVSAGGVQLRWQSSDRPAGQTASSTTATSSSASATSGSSDGLSTGAEIGIGVGVGLGALIVILAGLLFWLRRRKRQYRAAPTTDSGDYGSTKAELPGQAHQIQELDATNTGPYGRNDKPQELGTNKEPSELEGHSTK